METTSYLPLLLVVLPLLGGAGVFYVGDGDRQLRGRLLIGICALTVLMAGLLVPLTRDGYVSFAIPWFLGFGLRFGVDLIGSLFAFIVSLVWLLAAVFAQEYMAHEANQTRFFTFFVVTLGACIGVFLAGDLFSLFLFFEMMTFAAYVLIIHEEDRAALQAGNVYLFMSILGGLSLLAAVFLLQHVSETTAFIPLLEPIIASGISPWLILALVIVGFGVKAGLVPLHIWLPRAHPVAPSPASALLSALMIKAGAYGFIRFLLTILTPAENPELWLYPQHFGYLFMWIGAITMVVGAIMAILNHSMKRILAYSSISQMGYILFSLGIGAMLGERGAFGLAGTWMHMINHAIYKSFLFLLAGAVYLQTHELDLSKLGGLRTRMPWAFAFALIAAAGITGIPGFNGYVSKVLIHEAVHEAYYLKQWTSLLWFEHIFMLTGGLTAAYITKLWMGIFAGKIRDRWQNLTDISVTHRGLFAVYAVLILGIGLFAQSRVNQLVIPAVSLYSFYPKDILHLGEVPFWDPSELMGPVLSYVIGLVVLLFALRFGNLLELLRHISIEGLVYRPVVQGLHRMMVWLGNLHAPNLSTVKYPKLPFGSWRGVNPDGWSQSTRLNPLKQTVANDSGFSRDSIRRTFLKDKKTALQKAESHPVKRSPEEELEDSFWNTQNLNFASLLLALVIALSLLIFLSVRI